MFEKIFDNIRLFGTRVIQVIKEVGQRFGKQKTGKTLGSLYRNVKWIGEEAISLEVFGSKVFEYIEQGREPGAKLPPANVLLEFMKRVGIPREKEWGVRVNISKFGIKPTPLLETSFIEINRDFNNYLANETGARISEELRRAAREGFVFGELRI